MRQHIHLQRFDSPCGELMLGSFDGKLCLCDWHARKHRLQIDSRIQGRLGASYIDKDDTLLQQTRKQLGEYFRGVRNEFDIPLLTAGTVFQNRVWKCLQGIPYGQTASYTRLAACAGNTAAVRAVASANGANALSILIPCHRIIGADGSLRGYAGGLEAKANLLALESGRPSHNNSN